MKPALVTTLICPACSAPGMRVVGDVEATGEIEEGSVDCGSCARSFVIRRSIARFVSDDNYATSFGYQWNLHAATQLDAVGSQLSRERFVAVTRWPTHLTGERVLEAGAGAGRFTAILVTTEAEVVSFDYSNAVDANLANLGTRPNLHLMQADIYRIPFAPGSFDKVVCLGVLQHCPDPAAAFYSLVQQLAPGGSIVIDVYKRSWRSFASPRYWLRPITTRMDARRLYRIVQRAVPALLPLKRWLTERVPMGRYPAYLVPVAYQHDWRARLDDLTEDQLRELSVLDTFDWYSPRYDQPQTLARVRRWFTDAGLVDVVVENGPNGIVGRGTRPSDG